MNNDLINGIFEFIGGFLVALNIIKLNEDEEVKGVYLPVVAFFTAWSVWNLFYYPALHQPKSFSGALFLCFANLGWLINAYCLILIKKRKNKNIYEFLKMDRIFKITILSCAIIILGGAIFDFFKTFGISSAFVFCGILGIIFRKKI